LAGDGSQGSTDGSGGSASFYYPYGVTVDSSGYVYVADTYNSKIRKITPGGIVSTLAGDGYQGSTDGSGSIARFENPTGIAIDLSGNIFVSESIGSRIRKITPGGVVSTLAGTGSMGSTDGPGASATFSNPYRIAVDLSGNLYIADAGNNKIRKMMNTIYEVKVYGDFTGFGNGPSSWQGATNILDVSGWESNTALVDVSGAFNGATSFIGNSAASWDVSRFTNMAHMFYGATSFGGNLTAWNTGAVTNMSHMFEGATAQYNNNLLIHNLGLWPIGAVTNSYRFLYTNGVDTTLLDPKSPFFEFPATGTPATFVFNSGGAVTLPISGIDSSGIHVYWGSGPSRYYKNGASVSNTVSGNNQVNIWGNYSSFGNGATSWPGASNLLDVSGWGSNTILVDVSGAFNGATAFLGTTAASWDVSRFTGMSYMFFGASSFTTDLSSWSRQLGPLSPAAYDNFLTTGTTTNPKSPFYIGRSVGDGLTAGQFTNLLTTNIGKPNPPFQIDNAVYGTVSTRLYKIKNSAVSTLDTFASPAIGAMYRIDNKIFGIQGKKLFSCDVSSGDAVNSSAGTFIGDPSEFMTLDASGNLYACDNSGNLYRYSRGGTPGLNIIYTDSSNAIVSPISCDSGKIYGFTAQQNIFIYNVATGSPTLVSTQASPQGRVIMARDSGPSPSLDSLIAYNGNLYLYQGGIIRVELNNGSISLSLIWTFDSSVAPLNGYDPVGRIFFDASSNILYGVCSKGGAGLGSGLYGAGTLFAIDLDISGSGPTNLPGPPKFTVLVNYCSADYTRGAIPQSFSITNETGNAFVVTSGGPDSSVTTLHVGPRVNGSNYVVGSSGLPGYTANCFNKGTRILCAEDKWIPIEDLRVGCLIQTYRHGLRPIAKIIKGFMINNPDIWHSCMYTGKREGFEPLVITGGHGLLVDYLTESQQRAQASYWGTDEVVIDDLTVMIVPVSANFTKIADRSLYTYYHFALENDGDNDRRYGVYANGFLTETPSLNQLRAAE
jgi:surface protein